VGPVLSRALDGGEPITVRDEADVSVVREAIREASASVGLPHLRAEALVTAASELGQNLRLHAGGGQVALREVIRQGIAGLEVIARDRGPGIADPTAALKGPTTDAGQSPSGPGLGAGLAAAHRLADELDLEVRWQESTTARARKFASPLPRRELAILARACGGEQVIGDDAVAVRRDELLSIAVADGLGHGPYARQAATRALSGLRADPAVLPEPLAALEEAQQALGETRGVVMAVVRIDRRAGEVTCACAGNVSAHLYRDRSVFRFACPPGVLGAPGTRLGKLNVDRAPYTERTVLVMFTDGISSRLDLSDDPALLREHPMVIAHRILIEHGKSHDDNLVLVAT
jgi:anti-sigma regulatory factor (Ser/Thr protein kinase)